MAERIKEKSNFVKWYRNRNELQKTLLWGIFGIVFVSLIIVSLIETIRTYDSDISQNECNILRMKDVRYYLSLQEENNVLAFIYTYSQVFTVLIAAIAISWIFHGVGFRIVG